MSNQALIEALNEVQAWELTGVIQYMQHGLLVMGPLRLPYRKFFMEMSGEAHQHATQVGDKIVALGGIPSIEPKIVRQATRLEEMLRLDIELEKAALAAYLNARKVAEELGLYPQVFWLEEHIAEEQVHVEDLEKLARENPTAAVTAAPPAGIQAPSAG